MHPNQFDHGMDDDSGPDRVMDFFVFMLVFWPVAFLLGLAAFVLFPSYDLRLPTLVVALIAGWAGVLVYRSRAREGRGAI